MIAYHFTGDKLRDGSDIPAIGEWLKYEGKIIPCVSGLHTSEHPFDALQYAPGNFLHLVELKGDKRRKIKRHGTDKIVGCQRKILSSIDATQLLRRFARECALGVIHLWDAPEVVLTYLKTGDESSRDAAWAAAWAAAWDAARAAAWDAARDAAWAAARAAGDAAWAAEAARDAAWDAAWAAAWAAGDAVKSTQREKFKCLVDEALHTEEVLKGRKR